jgi:hypothetical protein
MKNKVQELYHAIAYERETVNSINGALKDLKNFKGAPKSKEDREQRNKNIENFEKEKQVRVMIVSRLASQLDELIRDRYVENKTIWQKVSGKIYKKKETGLKVVK